MTYGAEIDVYEQLGERAPVTTRPDPAHLLGAAWLSSFSSADTIRAYQRDLNHWLGWCRAEGIDPLLARRVHVDAWRRQGAGYENPSPRSLARRLAAVSSWYGYLLDEELAERNPAARVRRPTIDRDDSPTRGLTRTEARDMLAASALSPLRDRVAIHLMLLDGIRRTGVTRLDVTDLGRQGAHRTITYTAKGGKRRARALPPTTVDVIEQYLEGRTEGPLLITRTGSRVSSSHLFRAVRRCALAAGLDDPHQVTPQSLRHTFITLCLDDLGIPLHVVQDAAGHADPRQTQGYNRRRRQLDRDPAYAVAGLLA